MKFYGIWLSIITLCTVLIISCTETPQHAEQITKVEGSSFNASATAIPSVTVATAAMGNLPIRRQTNGRLRARQQIYINSQTGGILTEAPIEGEFYKAGATLAATNTRALQLARDRAAAALDEANFRHQDLLLRYSVNLPPNDTVVSDGIKAKLLIQSGLPAANIALEEAEFALEQATQIAPFSGRAADVQVQTGQLISKGEIMCTLINPNSLEAEFNLLEQEIATLAGQRTIYITPIAQPELQLPATLDIINPRVNDGGLLRVRARLGATARARLFPGMNVNITIEASSETAVLIPKEAIVLRSGKPLVFTYDAEEERAKWQYITIAHENNEHVALSEGVEPGQQVIITGNLNLDHDSQVQVKVK